MVRRVMETGFLIDNMDVVVDKSDMQQNMYVCMYSE